MTKISKNIFIFSILMLPVLSGYRFLNTSVSIADVFVILGVSYVAVHYKQKKLIIFTILGALVLLIHILVASPSDHIFTAVSRLIKYSFYLIFIIFFLNRNSLSECFTGVRVFLTVTSLVLVLQYLTYHVTGRVIFFQVPGLMPINDHIDIERIKLNLIWSFRPAGIYFEPAHFAYASTLLSIYLHRNREMSASVFCVTTLAQILSGSSFALAGAALNMFIAFHRLMLIARVCALFVMGIFAILFSGEIYEFILSVRQIGRLLDSDSVALYGRLLGGADSSTNFSAMQKMIGVGYGNFEIFGFMNSYYFMSKSIGYFGVLTLSAILISYFVVRGYFIQLAIISMLFFTSGMLLTIFIIYVAFMFINTQTRVNSRSDFVNV